MGISNFADICSRTPLPLCSLIKSKTHLALTNLTDINNYDITTFNVGILPRCYARSVDIANTLIFDIGNAFINIGALIVILIIIYNIRQKYTAIGRSEYLYFFQLTLLLIIFTLVVDCGVSPPGSPSYPYFVALQIGFAGASCWSLLINGLLGFNIWEDGTYKSMTLVRGFSFLGFAANFLASILTFKDWIQDHEMGSTNATAMVVVVYIVNAVILLVYVICQLLISLFVVKNLWVTGSIILGVFFFVMGQIIVFALSTPICEKFQHYLDGLFFGSLCNIFALMMLYKTWDMTTDDDLEFSVSINKEGDVFYNNGY
ncbi:hypothetical protein KAFR_0F00470 [Kazachstania africana CBS 2517]|uniref:Chitin synthase export chaperone n=1 Tax=Kazachstania africana (strain ATCC 22294 / BCRC 22015 / CBS 2517 / CECT 1963 / NBRC 1671 / NRRL Y-8276) TaxID=1071382 RepID=H2AW94_KAZAF|nr:hypothetical protein KAFR_0F00470 [Kazachstania africana CBS 2517]CCF58644.1 hypothetical protein KAFR_0F00470 [Kazachstania africana CBS 2517]